MVTEAKAKSATMPSPEELDQVAHKLDAMGLAKARRLHWKTRMTFPLEEVLQERQKSCNQGILLRGEVIEWKDEWIANAFGFPLTPGGVKPMRGKRTAGEEVAQYFQKVGKCFDLDTCQKPEFAIICRFANAIFSPKRPTRFVQQLASLLWKKYTDPAYEVNWNGMMKKTLRTLRGKLPVSSVRRFAPHILHLYAGNGALTPHELEVYAFEQKLVRKGLPAGISMNLAASSRCGNKRKAKELQDVVFPKRRKGETQVKEEERDIGSGANPPQLAGVSNAHEGRPSMPTTEQTMVEIAENGGREKQPLRRNEVTAGELEKGMCLESGPCIMNCAGRDIGSLPGILEGKALHNVNSADGRNPLRKPKEEPQEQFQAFQTTQLPPEVPAGGEEGPAVPPPSGTAPTAPRAEAAAEPGRSSACLNPEDQERLTNILEVVALSASDAHMVADQLGCTPAHVYAGSLKSVDANPELMKMLQKRSWESGRKCSRDRADMLSKLNEMKAEFRRLGNYCSNTLSKLNKMTSELLAYSDNCSDLESQLKDEKKKSVCQICFSKERDAFCFPRKHALYCFDCHEDFRTKNNTCPTCNGSIDSLLKFRSSA